MKTKHRRYNYVILWSKRLAYMEEPLKRADKLRVKCGLNQTIKN